MNILGQRSLPALALLGNNAYVYCIFASWRLFSDEADALTIEKTLMTIALNSTKVYKKIFATMIRCNEAVAFISVEPFDGASCLGHVETLKKIDSYCVAMGITGWINSRGFTRM